MEKEMEATRSGWGFEFRATAGRRERMWVLLLWGFFCD